VCTDPAWLIDDTIAILNEDAVKGHPTPITPQYFLAEMASPTDIAVTVSRADFEQALRELTPSVSQTEMDHYARIQRRFSRKADESQKTAVE
jgi:peroxin-6